MCGWGGNGWMWNGGGWGWGWIVGAVVLVVLFALVITAVIFAVRYFSEEAATVVREAPSRHGAQKTFWLNASPVARLTKTNTGGA